MQAKLDEEIAKREAEAAAKAEELKKLEIKQQEEVARLE